MQYPHQLGACSLRLVVARYACMDESDLLLKCPGCTCCPHVFGLLVGSSHGCEPWLAMSTKGANDVWNAVGR